MSLKKENAKELPASTNESVKFKRVVSLFLCSLFFATLPLAGIVLSGYNLSPYLEFPPLTRYVRHESFSAIYVMALFALVLFVVSPFIFQYAKSRKSFGPVFKQSVKPLPWWGYVGVIFLLIFWLLAWTRYPLFSFLQRQTFSPLWFSYVVIVNAVTFKRTGHCMILEKRLFFWALFPISSVFWWYFEYLNRFVQNWYYVGVENFTSFEYILFASISFSTVLPAVISTRELLFSFNSINTPFRSFFIPTFFPKKIVALSLLLFSTTVLAFIGIFPNLLYPALWLSPLIIIVSLQILLGGKTIFLPIEKGDWRVVTTSALGGLMCGLFWEMWNYFSYAKWFYSVPFVGGMYVFEMPIMGYAGYLPFGLECSVVAGLLEQWCHNSLQKS